MFSGSFLLGQSFRFYVFAGLSTFLTASGGDIFLCVKKDIEERHAKGLRPHWIPRG